MKKTTQIKMFNYELIDDYGELGGDEDWDIGLRDDLGDLFETPVDLPKGARFLNQKDYTLNSPLIADEVDEFLKFMKKLPFNPVFRHEKTWVKREKMLRSAGVRIEDLEGSVGFHSWTTRCYQDRTKSRKGFTEFITDVENDSKQTYAVTQSFLKGWAKLDIPYKNILPLPEEVLRYGQLFWDIYWIIHALNCSTNEERDQLKLLKGMQYVDKTNSWAYQSESLGGIVIGHGLVMTIDSKRVLDRNMTLMMKDVCLARFQTLINIHHRSCPYYSPVHYSKIVKLYEAGDRLFQRHGNMSFECIKTLESFSINELDKIARKITPLIPEFTSYQEYLNLTEETLRRIYPEFTNFVQCIKDQRDIRILLTTYGAFRHWGHPFIDYLEGLKSLYENVTMPKVIDKEYAASLASDLAKKILASKFKQESKWYVDTSKIKPDHPFYGIIQANAWPSLAHIETFGDHWHELPLTTCFEIPDSIDPSAIYSDKSHSPNLSEVLKHVQDNPYTPIKSKKVLSTFLYTPETKWKDLLTKIDNQGFEEDELIIGLTGKEREIKWKGRFFALMSWSLREYFVVTEYLIKEHILPFFDGITMSDDQTTVTRKMLDRTKGQGCSDYTSVTIANHIDYEKWNNHQRGDANNPVFRVMGQFLGYPHLIERTHEIFEKSQVYYRDRPDLMTVKDGKLENRGKDIVCWKGQAGGFEGLRQKGWSVVNLLAVERNARIRNTHVSALAQGDNQVIITKFLTADHRNNRELKNCLTQIVENNKRIMESIKDGTRRLGLIINKEETLQSAGMLVYGKNILFHGCLLGLEEKRLSRVTCMTNDQLPTMGNMLSTVTTNCLTVAHFAKDPVNAMISYNWLSNFSRLLMEKHNPALRSSLQGKVKKPDQIKSLKYKVTFSYLDPSLGGVGGMSLTRFLIRQFPDPVTESLSFWKIIYDNSDNPELKELAAAIGNPRLGRTDLKSFKRLVEDPESLNIPSSISAKTLIQEEIRTHLLQDRNRIKNEIVKQAITHSLTEGDRFILFLKCIRPCFPRFLNEFSEATYDSLVEKCIGLFENSKTIRSVFQKRMGERVDKVIYASELCSIHNLLNIAHKQSGIIWKCSSTHADQLRLRSWGKKIYGATVPHPAEMLGSFSCRLIDCKDCAKGGLRRGYVAAVIPSYFDPDEFERGLHSPYLGSRTAESTSLVHSWEKITKMPMIKRAMHLRETIGWYIDPNSNLAKSILSNVTMLTGESPGELIKGFARTGSALHRFSCSRVSNGGFLAQSPIFATWMTLSTDPLNYALQPDRNYDFMFQSCLVYTQSLAGLIYRMNPRPMSIHCHIGCEECLREIEEVQLDSDVEYKFRDVSKQLESWKPDGSKWFVRSPGLIIPDGDWESLSVKEKSYHIGSIQGFLFGEWFNHHDGGRKLDDLFPYTINKKVVPENYLRGVANGVLRASALSLLHRKSIPDQKQHKEVLAGNYWLRINALVRNESFLKIVQNENICSELLTISHRISPSFPANSKDIGLNAVAYFRLLLDRMLFKRKEYSPDYTGSWIFSDCLTPKAGGTYIISSYVIKLMFRDSFTKQQKEEFKELANLVTLARSKYDFDSSILKHHGPVYSCSREVRHSCKDLAIQVTDLVKTPSYNFSKEYKGEIRQIQVEYDIEPVRREYLNVPQKQNPLVSGLRIPQIATGSPLKLSCILEQMNIRVTDCICAGDGSGGWGAKILRQFLASRLIFNSLMDFKYVHLNGVTPSPPSAIAHLGSQISRRCVNLNTAWENPSDLSCPETWEYFIDLKRQFDLTIDLITVDMESTSEEISTKVECELKNHIQKILTRDGTVIYKTYLHRLWNSEISVLETLGPLFTRTYLLQTDVSSTFTSEVYVVFKGLRTVHLGAPYVVWSNLENFVSESFCFKSSEDELIRGIQVAQLKLTKGIPKQLLPIPQDELTSILMGIGVSNHQAIIAGLIMKDYNSGSGIEFCLYLKVLISALSFQVTSPHCVRPSPPSDQIVSSAVAVLIATDLWLSVAMKDLGVFKMVQQILDNGVNWYYKIDTVIYQVKDESQSNLKMYTLSWSFFTQTETFKSLRLDSKMSLMGSVIRSLHQQFSTINCRAPIRKNCIKQFKRHNLRVSFDEVQERTGALELT